MKKDILFIYPKMITGGSTTSLVSLLENIDTRKYNIDLLMFYSGGQCEDMIPDYVNRLPYACKYQNNTVRKLHQIISPKYMYHFLKSKITGRQKHNPLAAQQYMHSSDVYLMNKKIGKHYDAVMSYLEGYSCEYMIRHINADRKIAWYHIDYKAAGYDPSFDRDVFSKTDKIVLVSGKCKQSFDDVFPEFAYKTVVVENIISAKTLLRLSSGTQIINDFSCNDLNLVTTCRIAFESKGLDRAINALFRLKNESAPGFDILRWYIIGDGPDMEKLKAMIAERDLGKTVRLLGMQKNPHPFVKQMSLFFLPSRFEGKPMAVTEAQMLGLPALVTNYASAREQINNSINGMVVENSEEGIYSGLRYVLTNSDVVSLWAQNTRKTDYSNTDEIKRVEALIDGEQL